MLLLYKKIKNKKEYKILYYFFLYLFYIYFILYLIFIHIFLKPN
jgi:hypothetical protein